MENLDLTTSKSGASTLGLPLENNKKYQVGSLVKFNSLHVSLDEWEEYDMAAIMQHENKIAKIAAIVDDGGDDPEFGYYDIEFPDGSYFEAISICHLTACLKKEDYIALIKQSIKKEDYCRHYRCSKSIPQDYIQVVKNGDAAELFLIKEGLLTKDGCAMYPMPKDPAKKAALKWWEKNL